MARIGYVVLLDDLTEQEVAEKDPHISVIKQLGGAYAGPFSSQKRAKSVRDSIANRADKIRRGDSPHPERRREWL